MFDAVEPFGASDEVQQSLMPQNSVMCGFRRPNRPSLLGLMYLRIDTTTVVRRRGLRFERFHTRSDGGESPYD
ncbi:hypothetical protein [Streptomyces chartreusis]|uniref:hypothetical protein n=1 Tax=Streptomyces chartreusis TaxID=1969 RepID=UPI00379A8471